MRMFQYIILESKGMSEEIWACEICRKKNRDQILTGNWRLIDKCDSTVIKCDKCNEKQTEIEKLAIEVSAG